MTRDEAIRIITPHIGMTWCEAAGDMADEMIHSAGLDESEVSGDEYGTFHDEADFVLETAAELLKLDPATIDRNDPIPDILK